MNVGMSPNTFREALDMQAASERAGYLERQLWRKSRKLRSVRWPWLYRLSHWEAVESQLAEIRPLICEACNMLELSPLTIGEHAKLLEAWKWTEDAYKRFGGK